MISLFKTLYFWCVHLEDYSIKYQYTYTMKPGIVADEMFPEGTSAIMDMDDEVHTSKIENVVVLKMFCFRLEAMSYLK